MPDTYYDTVIMVLETLTSNNITLEFVKSRVWMQNFKMKNRIKANQNQDRRCYECGRRNH